MASCACAWRYNHTMIRRRYGTLYVIAYRICYRIIVGIRSDVPVLIFFVNRTLSLPSQGGATRGHTPHTAECQLHWITCLLRDMCRGLLYLAALKVGVLEGYCHALWQSAPSFMSSLAHLMAGSARTALRKTSLSAAGTRLDEAVRQL